jgi:hypothetical protein
MSVREAVERAERSGRAAYRRGETFATWAHSLDIQRPTKPRDMNWTDYVQYCLGFWHRSSTLLETERAPA